MLGIKSVKGISMKFTHLIQLHDFNTIISNLHPRCTPAEYYPQNIICFFGKKVIK